MTQIDVTFTPDPDPARALVLLKEDGEVVASLQFQDGAATVTLQIGRPYEVEWKLIGTEGDKLDVTWAAPTGENGKLIDGFEIDRNHPDCIPYAGGPLADHGSAIFQI